ncbi:MAG: DUF4239 domain-containing protein [Methylovirgula sp.]
MIDFITTAPLWAQTFWILIVPTIIFMFGPFVVRRFVALESLSTNNEVAGFKFATVGVLYAVLLAFSIIIVWEKFNDAEATVEREAAAAATIYHLVPGLDPAQAVATRDALTAYLKSVVTEEWSAMEQGRANRSTWEALGNIYTALLTNDQTAKGDATVKAEIFNQLNTLTQARRTRLRAAEGDVPGPLWIVLFGGAVLTIVFTFFFGTKNLRAQTLMTGFLSVLIFSELLIAVALDRPFTGGIREPPDAIVHVLNDFSP